LTTAGIEGATAVRVGGQDIPVAAGQAIIVRPDNTFQVMSIDALIQLLRGTPSADMIDFMPQATGTGGGITGGATPSSSSSTTSTGGGTASGR